MRKHHTDFGVPWSWTAPSLRVLPCIPQPILKKTVTAMVGSTWGVLQRGLLISMETVTSAPWSQLRSVSDERAGDSVEVGSQNPALLFKATATQYFHFQDRHPNLSQLSLWFHFVRPNLSDLLCHSGHSLIGNVSGVLVSIPIKMSLS